MGAEILADSESELAHVFERCHDGFSRIFEKYRMDEVWMPNHWSPESLSNFARDFVLDREFSPMVLNRIFRNIVQFRILNSAKATLQAKDDYLGPEHLKLLFFILAQKQRTTKATSAMDKVLLFLSRLNAVTGAGGLDRSHCAVAACRDRVKPLVGDLFDVPKV